MEYNSILDKAIAIDEGESFRSAVKRLAYVSVYSISQLTICERNANKPFNPLLGETYEFVNEDIGFLSEQVSHHPPVTANYCRGKKTNYKIWNNQKTNTKFRGKSLDFIQQYKTYIEFGDHNEKYEIDAPMFAAHNLIIGTPYVDIGGTSTIKSIEHPDLECLLTYTKRGWTTRDMFKVEGDVYRKNSKKKELLYKIHGNWNSKIYISQYDDRGKVKKESQELVFQKNEYPERWEYMYGMSNFSLQLNYFPNWLHRVVAPTDTRRRPDQRSLENGDMVSASQQKDRLEKKQRKMRRDKEASNIEHEPAYFQEFENHLDNQTYFIYNDRYFEQDRKSQDWTRLPDLFGEEDEENTDSNPVINNEAHDEAKEVDVTSASLKKDKVSAKKE